jgi:hypothetical protein
MLIYKYENLKRTVVIHQPVFGNGPISRTFSPKSISAGFSEKSISVSCCVPVLHKKTPANFLAPR